uniref:Uncharacterized protein n=1 Tax=Rhizophora mucronata TaxID=61149 RepID=A0A2P2PUZ9_RHIMU
MTTIFIYRNRDSPWSALTQLIF